MAISFSPLSRRAGKEAIAGAVVRGPSRTPSGTGSRRRRAKIILDIRRVFGLEKSSINLTFGQIVTAVQGK
jgi:hypothetical protein